MLVYYFQPRDVAVGQWIADKDKLRTEIEIELDLARGEGLFFRIEDIWKKVISLEPNQVYHHELFSLAPKEMCENEFQQLSFFRGLGN